MTENNEQPDLMDLIAEAFPDVPGQVNSKTDVNRYLYVIGRLTKEAQDLDEECRQVLEETSQFYAKKHKQKQSQIEFLTQKIEAYVRANGSCDMPNGKAATRKTHSYNWKLEGDDLVSWAAEKELDNFIKEKVKYSFDKAAYKKAVGDGESEAFEKITFQKFYINLPKEEDND